MTPSAGDSGEGDSDGVSLDGTALGGRDLAGANLRGADLAGVDLSGTDLSGSTLTGADLHGADLTDADLVEADLRGADLTDADLTDADLSGAALTGADMQGAVLDGAELAGADLRGADVGDDEGADVGDQGDEALSARAGSAVAGATIVLGLAAIFAGVSWFWMVWIVGFVVVAPAAGWLAEAYESRSEGRADDSVGDREAAALEELRDRYARGEIAEAEFERRVERLLETESVEDAADAYGDADASEQRERELDPE